MIRRLSKYKHALLGALFVAVLTIVVFLPAVRNGYLLTWDDDVYVRSNEHIRSLDSGLVTWAFTTFYGANYWHPLTWLSHALDYALWGPDPAGHHLTNIILHGLNAALVVLLMYAVLSVRRALVSRTPRMRYLSADVSIPLTAVLTGLLFGIHPLRAESVAWIAERKDVLCVFFSLLSLLAYTAYVNGQAGTGSGENKPRFPYGGYVSAFLFLLLALLSKPMAVTVPVVFLILDWAAFERPMTLRSLVLEKMPFYFLSLAAAAISLYAKYALHDIVSFDATSPLSRVLTGFHAIVFYLIKTVWPADLLPFYPYPGPELLLSLRYFAPVFVVAAITILCALPAKKQRLWLGVWAYYVITLLPVLPFLLVGEAPVADRFSYLPSLGPLFLAGLGGTVAIDRAFAAPRRRTVLRALTAAAVIAALGTLALLTTRQIHFQKNDFVLWNHEIESFPKDKAGEYLNFYLAYSKRGLALAESGRLAEAIADYQEVLRQRPDFAPLHVFTGVLYYRLGRFDDATREFQTAVTLEPFDAEAHRNLGIMYYNQKKTDEAIRQFAVSLRLEPGSLAGHFGMANALYLQGRAAAAIEHYEKALTLDAFFVKARNNLGAALMMEKRYDEAIRAFQSAAKLAPGSALIRRNLAHAYRAKGLKDSAAREEAAAEQLNQGSASDRNGEITLMN
jgi:tetratricopeptide (TPR) repeat protein